MKNFCQPAVVIVAIVVNSVDVVVSIDDGVDGSGCDDDTSWSGISESLMTSLPAVVILHWPRMKSATCFLVLKNCCSTNLITRCIICIEFVQLVRTFVDKSTIFCDCETAAPFGCCWSPAVGSTNWTLVAFDSATLSTLCRWTKTHSWVYRS